MTTKQSDDARYFCDALKDLARAEKTQYKQRVLFDAANFLDSIQPTRWLPIATAPRDGTLVLLAGPSGYVSTPLRVEVGRWDAPDPKYDNLNYKGSWRTHSNDHFTDGGDEPIYWMPLPTTP